MTLEQEHEVCLISLSEKSRELRRHREICKKAHEMVVDGGYELRDLLDILSSSWKQSANDLSKHT